MLRPGARASGISLTLLCPGLPGPDLAQDESGLALPLLPALRKLLAGARVRCDGPREPDTALASLFVHAPEGRDLPFGALTRRLYGGVAPDEYWLCAAPVHLQADVGAVRLLDASRLGIVDAEAQALVARFNAHFSGDGCRLVTSRADLWHLRMPRPWTVSTTPLFCMLGRSVFEHLPAGPEGRQLQKLLNETQMLLHDAPVNLEREREGRMAINGLWIWGGGVLPRMRKVVPDSVAGGGVLAEACAAAANIVQQSLPANFEEWRAGRQPGEHLICLDGVAQAQAYQDIDARDAALSAWESAWFAPLLSALADGTVERWRLLDARGNEFSLHRTRSGFSGLRAAAGLFKQFRGGRR